MVTRRQFLRVSSLITASLAVAPGRLLAQSTGQMTYPTRRPLPKDRCFTSRAVEEKILAVKRTLRDPELAWMFENCFPNTLDTTVTLGMHRGKPDTYVITGDIDAMWLRDSSAQVWPYLPLMKEDSALERMVTGVINRHASCVMIDPYANAFYRDAQKVSEWQHDRTDMKPGVHERKWEVDSLCYVIRLAYGYWNAGGNPGCFDREWLEAMRVIVRTFKEQQRKDGVGPYRFQRTTDRPFDTAAGIGHGNLARPNGLICSVFRPSDDATVFPYLIPSNFFAVVSLRQLAELVRAHFQEAAFANEASALADEVHQALKEHATIHHEHFGEILAYEVDGFGSCCLLDDANVPSLLSLPYLDAISSEEASLYERTRLFLLNADANPYYVRGRAAEGVSGPHAGRDMIWPMAVIMRALTSPYPQESARSLAILKATHAGTGFMHEAFHKDDAKVYTRPWFAWANTLFGEFILRTMETNPQLLT